MKIFSIILFNIISVFSFKQPIPFADVSLSKRSIHKVKIKNDETVAVWWNRKTKEWNAVNNICPHRQASLSDGVINPFTCNIKCRYHGLEFNKNGKCTSIPSSTFDTSIFSVKEYNIKEKYNLLWINDNELDIPTIDILEEDHSKLPWFVSHEDIPYDFLIENSIDSAHVNNVHSGMMPGINRYKPFGYFDEVSTNWFNETGFSCTLNNAYVNFTTDVLYVAPYYTYINFPRASIFAISIPLNDTSSRFISNLIIKNKNKNKKGKIQKIILNSMINIFSPLIKKTSPKIFSQDVFIINSQMENINNEKNYQYSGYADKPVILYNKWLEKYDNKNNTINNIINQSNNVV